MKMEALWQTEAVPGPGQRDPIALIAIMFIDTPNMRILLVDILTFDGFFGTKFDILKPRWLPTTVLWEEFMKSNCYDG